MSAPRPRESVDHCALAAELRGDPMIGTAPPWRRLLLVEQPGPWGPRGLLESRAAVEDAQRIDELAAAGGARMQAIRRPRGSDPGHQVGLAVPETGATWWWWVPTLADLAASLADLVTGGVLRPPPSARRDPDPLYLVCTHGRHDACCALRGRPVVRELERLRPGRVWETTHVGGDRFAANLLVLPSGEMYGRVRPEACRDLTTRVEAGEVVPDLMRGRVGLPPIAQAALVGVHARLAEPRRDAIDVLGAAEDPVTSVGEHTASVRLRTPRGTMTATVALSWAEPHQLTCRGPRPSRARVYSLVRLD